MSDEIAKFRTVSIRSAGMDKQPKRPQVHVSFDVFTWERLTKLADQHHTTVTAVVRQLTMRGVRRGDYHV